MLSKVPSRVKKKTNPEDMYHFFKVIYDNGICLILLTNSLNTRAAC